MSGASFDPETWQPVRMPNHPDGSKAYQRLIKWCEKHCRGSYLPVPDTDGTGPTVFWFEQSGDSSAFALRWFPLKGL